MLETRAETKTQSQYHTLILLSLLKQAQRQLMLIKTSEKMTQLRRFLEHYTPAEANTADEFTRLGKAMETVETPTTSLR